MLAVLRGECEEEQGGGGQRPRSVCTPRLIFLLLFRLYRVYHYAAHLPKISCGFIVGAFLWEWRMGNITKATMDGMFVLMLYR